MMWEQPLQTVMFNLISSHFGAIPTQYRRQTRFLSLTPLGIFNEGFDEVEVEGNKTKILYPDQYFDAVIDLCSICMEHNFSDISNETARLLKRGGRLFSIVPKYDCYDIFEGNDSVQFFTLEHLRKCLNGKFHSSIKLIEQELEPTKVLRFWLVDALRMT